jgi:hypothetical protein
MTIAACHFPGQVLEGVGVEAEQNQQKPRACG